MTNEIAIGDSEAMSKLIGYIIADETQREREHAELVALRSEVDRLRTALQAVEWVTDCMTWCPWCENEQKDGHHPDCPRQAALNAAVTKAMLISEQGEDIKRLRDKNEHLQTEISLLCSTLLAEGSASSRDEPALLAEVERLRTALQAAYDKLENMHHIEASYIIAAALDCGA